MKKRSISTLFNISSQKSYISCHFQLSILSNSVSRSIAPANPLIKSLYKGEISCRKTYSLFKDIRKLGINMVTFLSPCVHCFTLVFNAHPLFFVSIFFFSEPVVLQSFPSVNLCRGVDFTFDYHLPFRSRSAIGIKTPRLVAAYLR